MLIMTMLCVLGDRVSSKGWLTLLHTINAWSYWYVTGYNVEPTKQKRAHESNERKLYWEYYDTSSHHNYKISDSACDVFL